MSDTSGPRGEGQGGGPSGQRGEGKGAGKSGQGGEGADPVASASAYVDSEALPWRDTPYAGVSWKKLRFDVATGESAVLLRFAPRARYGAHRHPRGEEYLVLSGTLQDGGRSWGAGAFVRHAPGSVHAPRSESGCTVFVTLPAPIEIVEG